MIVVTGGAGFIGSAVVWQMNKMNFDNIVIVDELRKEEKWKNLNGLKFADFYHKNDFLKRIAEDNLNFGITAIIHLGACSATTEKDADYLLLNNYKYSQTLAEYCAGKKIRFIYASSAATYGDGRFGYIDNEAELDKLRPLNMYGYSKHLFDLWMQRTGYAKQAVGIKYFNVYGPNEYHKGDMRSVVHKAFEQINETGKVKLFKSYMKEYADGEQKRDFVYVKDAVNMTLFFLDKPQAHGLFNVGTGNARSWNDLVRAIFKAMGKPENIEYIDMPEELKGKYQYFTKADSSKIKKAGFDYGTLSLEDAVTDYVQNYLMRDKYLGQSPDRPIPQGGKNPGPGGVEFV